MPESPFKQSKTALKSRYNALPFHSHVITTPSHPSTVAANDHEIVAPPPIENGADQESKDPRNRPTRAAKQPSRNPSSAIRKIIQFAIILVSSLAQVLCAIVIGQYDALHTRSGLSTPLNLIRIWCWQKSKQSDSACFFGLHLPDFIIDPSEFVFAITVMVYGLAMLIFYDTRKGDRYQDHFLASGGNNGYTDLADAHPGQRC
ncbi:hypothetical protein B0O99DRAFT_600230 [Bisporella sp. PMI_857]|nr:hypothetical protein B0O99DRAFT_600230 [Bisporella sp. PMI_857]